MTAERWALYDESRLRNLFVELGLDALVVRSGQNVSYLSGLRFPGTLGRLQDFAHSPRGAVVLRFPDGATTLLVSRIAAPLARRWSWVDDVREFTEYADDPFELTASDLRDRGLSRGRIGIERRLLSVAHYDTLARRLPGAELVECSDSLERARNVKTEAEIAIMRHAARVQDEAHLEVFRGARPGDTERELHARMLEALARHGAESAHGMMQSSRNPVTYGGEGDIDVRPGDLIRTDYVSYHEGYAANLSRMAVMGPPSAAQEEMYDLLLGVHRDTVALVLRPGVKAADVYEFVCAKFVAAGFPDVAPLVGHSIGIWWHQEEPMLIPTESRMLERGMVICLEPILDRYWHLQDELLLTDGGSELLSDRADTDELFQMAV